MQVDQKLEIGPRTIRALAFLDTWTVVEIGRKEYYAISMDSTQILAVEARWFERGVREVIHIRLSHVFRYREGGRYNLPSVWDNLLKSRVNGAGIVAMS